MKSIQSTKSKILKYLGGFHFGNEYHFHYPKEDVTFIFDVSFMAKGEKYEDRGRSTVDVGIDPTGKKSDCTVKDCPNHSDIGCRIASMHDCNLMVKEQLDYICCGYIKKTDSNYKALLEEINEIIIATFCRTDYSSLGYTGVSK